jgi:hypothetical protein
MLCNNVMRWSIPDPLSLGSGAGARLALSAVLAAALWAGVAWAMLPP